MRDANREFVNPVDEGDGDGKMVRRVSQGRRGRPSQAGQRKRRTSANSASDAHEETGDRIERRWPLQQKMYRDCELNVRTLYSLAFHECRMFGTVPRGGHPVDNRQRGCRNVSHSAGGRISNFLDLLCDGAEAHPRFLGRGSARAIDEAAIGEEGLTSGPSMPPPTTVSDAGMARYADAE